MRSFKNSNAPWLICIVEDDEVIRLIAVEFFKEVGFSVIEAEHAARALTLIEEAIDALGIVFTDIQMPGEMDGVALARHLQVHYPHIPVILTSGAAAPVMSASNRRFVSKPYHLPEVERHVRDLLRV